MQGECFSNCPLMAALASIAWVNRKFIVNNAGPDGNGNYKFTFWDYGQNNPMTQVSSMMANNTTAACVPTNGGLNPVTAGGTPNCTKAQVTVGPQVLLDGAGCFSDPNGTFYGAGSGNVNEVWPALFERAYAKFCYYENNIPLSAGALTSSSSVDASGNPVNIISGPDPSYADVLALGNNPANPMENLWGGNAGVGLAYLTGRLCFQYSTTAASFSVPPLSHINGFAAGNSLYNFIKIGFCSIAAGNHKTRYPLVAWTNASGNQYSAASQGIVAGHCYPILGIFDASNGCTNGNSYIVLRTTYGLSDPLALAMVASSGSGIWQYNDEGFAFPGTPASPLIGMGALKTLDLSVANDAIFGLDARVFSNYFQSIAWAETY